MPPSASEPQVGEFVLPTVNFRDFLYGPDWLRNEAAKTIIDSFINHGFCKFTHHGIPDDIVQGIFDWVSTCVAVTVDPADIGWVEQEVLPHDAAAEGKASPHPKRRPPARLESPRRRNDSEVAAIQH